MKNTHPAKVFASGGAAWRPRTELYGNIYDHLDADFTFANGVHMSSHCRQFRKPTYQEVSELIIGTRGRTNCKDMGPKGEDPYVQEHIALVKSIRGQGPYINDGMALLAHRAARAAANQALNVQLETRLDEREISRPQPHGYFAVEDGGQQGLPALEQVGDGNVAIDHHAF